MQDIEVRDGQEDIHLKESVKNPTIVCGFKGFGMTGPLVANHLLEEMQFEEIGSSELRDVPPVAVLKDGKMYKPIGIFENKEKGIILVSILAPTLGIEWEIADIIEDLYRKTGAKEIIIPDGTITGEDEKLYHISSNKINVGKPIQNSVISGITSAMLMKKDINIIAFLGNASEPDIKAAAAQIASGESAVNVIDGLNQYLDLEISTDKLKEMSENMHKQLENYMQQIQSAQQQKDKGKSKGYIG